MNMKSKYIPSFLLPFFGTLLMPAGAAGQNLDPTVEVSRNYEAKLMEIHKPSMVMEIPDTVQQFDLDFDYSVFESPYKGTYEFNPYLLNMKPLSGNETPKKFFLRAGAGYTLHPELDFIWSPAMKGKFKISVYGSHRSYFGKYRGVYAAYGTETGDFRILTARPSGFSGYETESKAGVSGRADWNSGIFSFDVGYYGIASKDTALVRGYDAADVKLRIKNTKTETRKFIYDISLDYRIAEDKLEYTGAVKNYLMEQNMSLDALLGARLGETSRITVNAGADMASYNGAMASSVSNVFVTPKYEYSRGRWQIGVGVMAAFLTGADNTAATAYRMHSRKGQIFYPDVNVEFELLKKQMSIYFKAEGGNGINSYSGFLSGNRFFEPGYSRGLYPLLDNTVERVSASLGIKGNIAVKFSYDLKAGYRNVANAPMDAAVLPGNAVSGNLPFIPVLAYADCQSFFVSADMKWRSEDVSADAAFIYRSTDIRGGAVVFEPAPLQAGLRILYNWNRRIFGGLDCEWLSGRDGAVAYSGPEGTAARIPGFFDLGLYAEYKFNRKLSLWARGGNLLDMPLMYVPGYVESGINFTAGICLNL